MANLLSDNQAQRSIWLSHSIAENPVAASCSNPRLSNILRLFNETGKRRIQAQFELTWTDKAACHVVTKLECEEVFRYVPGSDTTRFDEIGA